MAPRLSSLIRPVSALLLSGLISISIATQFPAQAIQGGEDAAGDNRVVAIVFGSNTRASCSGVPITPYVVVAAAHCLSNPSFTYSSERYIPTGISISQPGADLSKDVINERPKVLSVALTPGFSDKSFTDDIAFYFLNSPLQNIHNLDIGNLAELREVKEKNLAITHVGYGYIGPGNIEDFRPHSITLKAAAVSSSRFGYLTPSDEITLSTDEFQGRALCKHDSGGPFLASINGGEKVMAINLSADGCDRYGANSIVKGTLGISIYPYLDLLERNWSIFAAENPSLPNLESASKQLAEKLLVARAVVKAQPSPTPTTSVAPSVSPKSQEVPTTPNTQVARKTLKMITCIKGKSTKIVKSYAPKCPSGYKIKA